MPYPVVAEHFLPPVPRRRLRARRRSAADLPRPTACQRLVYYVRGAHFLDDTAMSPDSPTVIEASRVSVVDITANTAVVIPLTIPSKDATAFTLHATFLCTVDDPVAVVHAGAHQAEPALRAYLTGYHGLFDEALDYTVAAINEARRRLSTLLRAYTMVTPPTLTGMTTTLAAVEIHTPDELTRLSESLRDEASKHAVAMARQRHQHALEANQQDHENARLHQVSRAVADDPIAALTLSYTRGDITAKELAAELKEIRGQQITQDHEDLRSRLHFEREQEKARHAWEKESHKLAHDERLEHLSARREFILEAAKHGHLDTMPVHLDKLLTDFLDGDPVPWHQLEPPEDKKPRVEDLH